MKILYLASGKGEDYQCDVLFHGLRELLGADAIDANRIASLYQQANQARPDMYGRGYTVYANLPEIDVDRSGIAEKIRMRFFDLVIYGSIHRYREFLPEVLQHYPRSRVVFVDGEDQTRMQWPLLGKGIYFKRELLQALPPFIQPVHFAVPAVKFVSDDTFETSLHSKNRLFAPCDPRDRSTYVFMTEAAYYQQYRESCYGITMKKLGWDCMRHHEIAAQGAAPYFLDLENCPAWTLHRLPKPQLLELRRLVDQGMTALPADRRGRYEELMREIFRIYRQNFTTTGLARYVLERVAESQEIDRATIGGSQVWQRRLRCYFTDRFAD